MKAGGLLEYTTKPALSNSARSRLGQLEFKHRKETEKKEDLL